MAAKLGHRFPMLPPVSLRFAQRGRSHPYVSAFSRDDVAWCSRGCDALSLVYSQAALRPDDLVVMPALHCPSIADATRQAGLQVAFHRINPDLSPVDADIIPHLENGARALLLIHYFGFMQDAKHYRALCDHFGALLIEDCAHTIFGVPGNPLPGETGHFAIASQRKLFPVPDGGAAIANPGPMNGQVLSRPGWVSEVRAAMRTVQYAADYGTLGASSRPLSSMLDLLDRLRGAAKRAADQVPAPHSAPGAPAEVRHSLLRESRVALRLRQATSITRLAGTRRNNYQRMVDSLGKSRDCTPLIPDLLPGTVPYVVPVVVRNAEKHFSTFKQRGIPMYRWEGIGNLGCEVTRTYSTDLIQLPCHQELSPENIDWMANELVNITSGKYA